MATIPSTPPPIVSDVTPGELELLRELAAKSHAIITVNQQPSGAYPACVTFSAYAGYAWFRDGAFTAEGVSRYGDVASADSFHDWCSWVLAERRDQVDALVERAAAGAPPVLEEMLPTRFTYAGEPGSDAWWDFQTDGYGMWLWSVVAHAERHGLDLARWWDGIEVAVDYLCAFWELPCYDWWEEHVEHRHVSTLGAIAGGLQAIAGTGLLDARRDAGAREVAWQIRKLVEVEGGNGGRHLTKWLGTDAVDGSLPACIVPFGLVEPGSSLATGTLEAVAEALDVDGGVHRFRADVFYGGGQWLLLSALLGWNLAATGDRDGALRHLRWVVAHTTDTGEMPEQVDDHLLHPESRQEWLDRWGPVATPLLWSHGMYIILADELGLLEHPAPGTAQ
jgi:GH15 family glucan-1,4-alpha-glucosidase